MYHFYLPQALLRSIFLLKKKIISQYLTPTNFFVVKTCKCDNLMYASFSFQFQYFVLKCQKYMF